MFATRSDATRSDANHRSIQSTLELTFCFGVGRPWDGSRDSKTASRSAMAISVSLRAQASNFGRGRTCRSFNRDTLSLFDTAPFSQHMRVRQIRFSLAMTFGQV